MLGWRTVCAVELAAYPRDVLLARQRDGSLDRFPIWDDVSTFDGKPWRGSVDVVSGGPPCQPFSSAARGRNVAVDMWPEMLRVVDEVRPTWVIVENVRKNAVDGFARDLRVLGYMVECAEVSASAVGAPHLRERFWAVAHSDHEGERPLPVDDEVARTPATFDPRWGSPPPPSVLGLDDGVPPGVVRRAIGNGQVPQCAALAFDTLAGRLT
jgi:DNA (cytosine-5)-methyltransferase 1